MHIIVWRLANPKNYILALLLVFVVVPPMVIGAIEYMRHYLVIMAQSDGFRITFTEWLSIFFMYFSFVGAYILSYPAIQASCPSLSILLIIRDSMPRGTTYEELKSLFDIKGLVNPRLKDLVDSRFAVEKDGYYTIAKQGKLVLKIFMFLRRFLGLPMGAG